MDKYVILHGHFYQPPREDPWSGNISFQESASPFINWNKRINAECYAAGAASRVLDSSGKIQTIINNYQTLSWNFGPTLLTWLEKEAPNVHRRIVEADYESRDRLGYGNAVAQAYNHTILPLDRPRDVRTQVTWGLTDFRQRFGREADGMWLPECAVSNTVLDILIEMKLSYVILSPWQAEAIRKDGETWTELESKPGPTDRPFTIRRPGGEIAAFFYDPELASAISFGHLLQSREGLEGALSKALDRSGGNLVSIATDGEIYGHHEPFGDMCLAALIDRQDRNIIFTNYAAYLAANPPKEEARLRYGDDGLGSSWSCSHGVGRWMRDCGCSTGSQEGWTQKWRKPLRTAYDRLRDSADPVWMESVRKRTGLNPVEVLDEYGMVLAGKESPGDFAGRMMNGDSTPEAQNQLLEALEGAKYLQFMYTSCGWFFSELSGLEPVQNLRYAYRATELLDPDGSTGMLSQLRISLEKAISNIPEMGSGSDILDKEVIPTIDPDAIAAASFFWCNLYNLAGRTGTVAGDLQGGELTRRTVGTDDKLLQLEGEVEFLRKSTLRRYYVPYRATVDGRLFCPEISVQIREKWRTVPVSAMPKEIRLDIQETLLGRSEGKLRKCIGNQALIRLRDVKMIRELNLPLAESRRQSVELSLFYGPILTIKRLKKLPATAWPGMLEILDEILSHRKEYGMIDGTDDLESRSGRLVSRIAESLQAGSDRYMLENLVKFLEIIQNYGLNPLKPYAQNSVFALLTARFDAEDSENAEGMEEEDLISLARMMNINPERFIRKEELAD